MELKTLFGLPAHPLVIHAVVVLLPLAALGLVVVAAIPRARRHYAPVVLAGALVAMLSVLVATGSGEQLEERVDDSRAVEQHKERGERVLPWSIAVVVVAGAVVIEGPVRRRVPSAPSKAITAVLVVAALVSSTGAAWTVSQAGHSGTKATWGDLPTGRDGGGDD